MKRAYSTFMHSAYDSAKGSPPSEEKKPHSVSALSASEVTGYRADAGDALGQQCGHDGVSTSSPTDVEQALSPRVGVAQQEELGRQLVENESQRTEIGGYINQLNIQIHRWQLRLQKLNERNAEIKGQLEAGSGKAT